MWGNRRESERIGRVRSSVCCGSAQVAVAQINFKSKYKLAYVVCIMFMYQCFFLLSGLKSTILVWFIYGSCVSFPSSPKQTEALINFIAGVDRQVRAHLHTLTHTNTHLHSLTYLLTHTKGVCAMSLTYEPTAWMFVFAKHFLTLLFSGCLLVFSFCFGLFSQHYTNIKRQRALDYTSV